jgi:hypothetical protein
MSDASPAIQEQRVGLRARSAGRPSTWLDACARLHVDRRQRFGSYLVLGCVGFVAAVAVAVAASSLLGAPAKLVLLLTPVAALTFLAAVKVTSLVFGAERIVFYEQALLVLATGALALRLAHLHVAAGLDLLVLGLGVFLAFGRVGCFMVGCCHGRPGRWGVRYGRAHAEAGFHASWVDKPLFPLQLVEATTSLGLAAGALAWAALRAPAPGELAFAYLSGYGVARFGLELFRGDAARPSWLGLSQAQLTALLVAWGLVALRSPDAGVAAWSAATALSLATAGLVAHRRFRPLAPLWLRSPWHLAELEGHLAEWDRRPAPGPRVATTRLGLRVSRQLLGDDASSAEGLVWDLLFSSSAPALRTRTVRDLVDDLGLLRDAAGDVDVVVRPGATPGLVHVLFPAVAASGSTRAAHSRAL